MDVKVTGPDGRAYVVDEANLAEAEKLGYKPGEGPAAGVVADAGEALSAGVLGAVQGITAGGYGVEEGLTDKESAKTIRRAAEEHPIATGAGELAGMFVSPVGEAGAAVRTGIAPATALGRLGANVVAGSVEGSLFGAGNTLSDSMLGDHQLTAQKLVAGMGLGALLGGAGGGLGGLLDEAVSRVLPKAGKALEGAQGSLKEFADNRWLKAGGAIQSDLKKIPDWKKPLVADEIRTHASGDLRDTFESLKASHEETGDRIGKLVKAADELDKKAGLGGPKMDPQAYLADANPLERPAIQKDVDELAAALQLNAKTGGGYEGAHDILRTLGRRANWNYRDIDPIRNGLLKDLYREARADWEGQVAPLLGSDLAKEFGDVNARYGALTEATKLARHGLDRHEGNRFISATDYLTGIAGGLMSGHPVTGIASAIAHKVIRERGAELTARLVDAIRKSPILQTVATSFGRQLAANSTHLGEYAPILLQELKHSPAQALATHMAYAQMDPTYQQAAQQAGFLQETPEEHQTALGKAYGLASMGSAVVDVDKEIDRALGGIIRGAASPKSFAPKTQDFGAKRMRKEGGTKQRMDEVSQLASNPDALLERVAANVGRAGEVAPGVAAALADTAHKAVAFLAPKQPVLPPLARPWTPSEAELHDFNVKLQAVEQPLSVLEHAKSGTLVKSQVQALQAVYPQLAAEVQRKALAVIASGKSVPYRARLMLYTLTGVDPDGTMSGKAILANQTAIQRNKSPGVPGSPKPQKSDFNLAQRMGTPTQRREMEKDDA